MENLYDLRELSKDDHPLVREVYEDAIESQGSIFYDQDQINAWSSLAKLPGVLDKPLNEGTGWVSCEHGQIEAFAVRYPSNRLALLYCRGRSSRLGHATSLLTRIELDARKDPQKSLITEASLFSYPLLLRCGWRENGLQKITIAGVPFYRYLMEKQLS